MTKTELAQSYMWDLYSESDQIAKLVDQARYALDNGHAADAAACLERASQPAELLEMRLRDTRKAIEAIE